MIGPRSAFLADGRLHLQHGPIDLVIEARGGEAANPHRVTGAYARAAQRFQTILPELVEELPILRSACPPGGLALRGAVARRMERAVRPFAPEFVTPMAAVAGAVADEIANAMILEGGLARILVNNGGDIALHLGKGENARIGIAVDPVNGLLAGRFRLDAASGIGGVATSGWRGRSFSLGIADAVTVLARNGAEADAAATMIANRIDLPGSSKVARAPARALAPDSDLGERLVVTNVGALSEADIAGALDRGEAYAERILARGLIAGAALALAGHIRLVGAAERFEPIQDQALALSRQDAPISFQAHDRGRNR